MPPNTTLHSCPSEIRTAGSYDSCLWTSSVQVMTSNVTITRSRVLGRVGDGGTGLYYNSTRNLRLVDVEIDGSTFNDPFGQAAIGQDGWSCLRCNVHHTGRGANFGTNVSITDSWFHDFVQASPGAHMSAAGNTGGQHSAIVHNTLDCAPGACSGALVMYGDFSPIVDIEIRNNLFNSGGSYCLYAGSAGGKPYPVATNVRVVDNRWGRKYNPPQQPGGPSGPRCGIYGPVAGGTWPSAPPSVWSGNAWIDGGVINP